jgi:hypothetical protein
VRLVIANGDGRFFEDGFQFHAPPLVPPRLTAD